MMTMMMMMMYSLMTHYFDDEFLQEIDCNLLQHVSIVTFGPLFSLAFVSFPVAEFAKLMSSD